MTAQRAQLRRAAPSTGGVREPAEASQQAPLDACADAFGGGRLSRIVSFSDAGLFPVFGLPGTA